MAIINLKKYFNHELQKRAPDTRLVLLGRKRATLFKQCKYKASKRPEFNLPLATDLEN